MVKVHALRVITVVIWLMVITQPTPGGAEYLNVTEMSGTTETEVDNPQRPPLATLYPPGVYAQYKKSREVVFISYKIFPPISLILNLCSLVVFIQPSFRRQNIGMVMSGLAVSDILAQIVNWNHLIDEYVSGSWMPKTSGLCRLMLYATYLGRCCSSWYICLFSFERFIAVAFPLKKSSLLTKFRMRFLFSGVTVLCMVALVYIPILVIRQDRIVSVTCTTLPAHNIFYKKLRFGINLGFGFLVPAFLTGVFNCGIVYFLWRYAAKRNKMAGKSGAKKGISDAVKNLTIMLFSVSTFSIVSYMPAYIVDLAYRNSPTTDLVHRTARNYLLVLVNLNFSCNFIIYCLTGRQFRNEFIKIITCGKVDWVTKSVSTYATNSSNVSVTATSKAVHRSNGDQLV